MLLWFPSVEGIVGLGVSMRTGIGKTSPGGAPVTVSFGEKFISSEQFRNVFREGMALVEETAAYLDGPGRRDSRKLPPELSFAYATESMRLTTRLMQMASWLLVRRAVSEGEMTPEQAEREEHKVNLQTIGRLSRSDKLDQLPEQLQELVGASIRFYQRIVKLDRMIRQQQRDQKKSVAAQNPVDGQMARIEAAFSVVPGKKSPKTAAE